MMYNRYIPQPDGSFSRCRIQDNIPDTHQQQRRRPPCPPPKQEPQKPPEPCPPPQHECPRQEQPRQEQRPPCKEGTSIPDFFRQLLPKGLDTGDLLVILLLLLMAGDCDQDRNTAMLTLVLYMFL